MADTELAFVLGTRPEIIKLGPVISACERRGLAPVLVHTGQHYSDNLDATFFRQLALPEPTYNLDIGSGTHGAQTGEMLVEIEATLMEIDPEIVVVQGDTNSALAGALAGCKLDVTVAHVEAGLRSFDREMPEEINRVVVDHISDLLFAPTAESARYLRREGIPSSRTSVTGNTIADAVLTYVDRASEESDVLSRLDIAPGEFYLLTAHREENVDRRDEFESLLEGVHRYAARTDREVIYPIHPRAKERLAEFELTVPETIRLVEPLDFFDFLLLEREAALVFTDSGGVQEETCILGTPCVTLRYSTERPETVAVGANCLAGLSPPDILAAAERMVDKSGDWDSPFGDGKAGERIVSAFDIEGRQSVSAQ
jgi:UDP-N-acetylglucosamine 2-epimerase (non-hydrolysing)